MGYKMIYNINAVRTITETEMVEVVVEASTKEEAIELVKQGEGKEESWNCTNREIISWDDPEEWEVTCNA